MFFPLRLQPLPPKSIIPMARLIVLRTCTSSLRFFGVGVVFAIYRSIPERWKKESSKCIQAFAKLDKNGDGFITCAEFRACFPPRYVETIHLIHHGEHLLLCGSCIVHLACLAHSTTMSNAYLFQSEYGICQQGWKGGASRANDSLNGRKSRWKD